MNNKQIQEELNKRGFTLTVDGLIGKNTRKAIDNVLSRETVKGDYRNWTDDRRLIAFEQIVYKDAGIDIGHIDGLAGEQTRYARTAYQARLDGDKSVETWRDEEPEVKPSNLIVPDKIKKWPRQTESEMNKFFGEKGKNQIQLVMPFPVRIAWDLETTTSKVSCNKLVAPALARIWDRTLDYYGHEEIRKLRLDVFGGCLNVRKMRGGSAWSIHSWGCAWDLDPDRNQLKWSANLASLDDPPYNKFWEFVYDEGAISLGKEKNYDWMHWQFARL